MINYRGVARCVCVCVCVCSPNPSAGTMDLKKNVCPVILPRCLLSSILTPCSPNTSTANRCKVESKFVHVCSKVTSPVSIPYWLEIYMIYSVAMVAVVAVAMVLMVLMVVMVVTVSSLVFLSLPSLSSLWLVCGCFFRQCCALRALKYIRGQSSCLLAPYLPFAVPWFRSSRIRPHPNLALGFLNSPESQPKIGPIPISVLDKNAPGFFTVFSHITKLKNVHRVAWKTSKTCMFWKIAFKIVKNHIFCNLAQAPNMCFPHVKAQKMLIANCCNLLVSRARLSKTLPLFGASLPS